MSAGRVLPQPRLRGAARQDPSQRRACHGNGARSNLSAAASPVLLLLVLVLLLPLPARSLSRCPAATPAPQRPRAEPRRPERNRDTGSSGAMQRSPGLGQPPCGALTRRGACCPSASSAGPAAAGYCRSWPRRPGRSGVGCASQQRLGSARPGPRRLAAPPRGPRSQHAGAAPAPPGSPRPGSVLSCGRRRLRARRRGTALLAPAARPCRASHLPLPLGAARTTALFPSRAQLPPYWHRQPRAHTASVRMAAWAAPEQKARGVSCVSPASFSRHTCTCGCAGCVACVSRYTIPAPTSQDQASQSCPSHPSCLVTITHTQPRLTFGSDSDFNCKFRQELSQHFHSV